MIIAPVIFCTVVTGIAGMSDMKMVGKAGGLALLYFEIVSTVALVIGLLIVNTVQPGVGMHVDPSTLDQSAVSAYAGPGKMQTTTQFLMNIIRSLWSAPSLKAKFFRFSFSRSSLALRCTSSAVAARSFST